MYLSESDQRLRMSAIVRVLALLTVAAALLVSRNAHPQDNSSSEPPAESPPEKPQADADKVQKLTPKQMIDEWISYCENGDECNGNWTAVKRPGEDTPLLVCRGTPFGYLRSRDVYGNFEMGLQWRYPTDAAGNSGILIFVDGEDKIWPQAIQIQFHTPAAGSIFPIKPATCENQRMAMDLARPVNEWNTCRIVCRGGRVSAEINGQNVGEVTGCTPRSGRIALQSEGAEVHFRNVWLRPSTKNRPSSATATEPDCSSADGR